LRALKVLRGGRDLNDQNPERSSASTHTVTRDSAPLDAAPECESASKSIHAKPHCHTVTLESAAVAETIYRRLREASEGWSATGDRRALRRALLNVLGELEGQ